MIDLKIISNTEYAKIKKKKQFVIHYGSHKSRFGKCLIGLFGDRICHLSFVNESDNLNVLKSHWPGCVLVKDSKLTAETVKKVFERKKEYFKVLLRGSCFERKVWLALMNIPEGKTVSYEAVAIMTGHDKAVRAAANAVAKNYVSYLVPCHRVIKKDGSLHKYGGGIHIKKKILEYENCFEFH